MYPISALELKKRLDAEDNIQIIDVREDSERDIAQLPDTHHITLEALMNGKLSGLDADIETIVYCHTGGRSSFACEVLTRIGFKKVYNLEGGIEAYRSCVDSTLRSY